ncbi:MAG TPA: PCP reductase family protein [Candidatus Polarisedimenticolia bacterium]|nr:PCP reductase family protein [Candidatus Polarisedimenticolia bacterium]
MKFLCVPCDQPMKLADVAPPDRGSLSVRYACPECGYEMAMLTNPFETQMVQSLGVRIGPEANPPGGPGSLAAAAAGVVPSGATASGGHAAGAVSPGMSAMAEAAAGEAKASGGKCPFAGMIPGLSESAKDGAPAGTNGAAAAPVPWTDAATARLESIPSFVRPMARTGIEQFARERGYPAVDEKVLDEARDFFGM